jgi:hypothetical protein
MKPPTTVDGLLAQLAAPASEGLAPSAALQATLLGGVQLANALPKGEDYEYVETYGEFRRAMASGGRRVLARIAATVRLLDGEAAAVPGAPPAGAPSSSTASVARGRGGLSESLRRAIGGAELGDATLPASFGAISDALDVALEGVDRSLRRHARGETAGLAEVAAAADGGARSRGNRAPKPQDSFDVAPDNSRAAWVPIIAAKAHALAPLASPLRRLRSDSTYERTEANVDRDLASHARSLGVDVEHFSTLEAGYAHPYQEEVDALCWHAAQLRRPSAAELVVSLPLLHDGAKKKAAQRAKKPSKKGGPVREWSARAEQTQRGEADKAWTLVASRAALEQMCAAVRTLAFAAPAASAADAAAVGPAVAVDLEHHSHRSFQGITALMQVTAGLGAHAQTWLVDTLQPEVRSSMHVCNDFFADPSIVKVMHGANMDVQWLQRDFGVYVVNLFDTGQATRVLKNARFSLAHLLKRTCGVDADKQCVAIARARAVPPHPPAPPCSGVCRPAMMHFYNYTADSGLSPRTC